MTKIRQDPYQISIANQIKEAFDEGCNDVFVELPTGGGKSGVAWFVHSLNKLTTCVMSHQKILLDQYQDLLRGYCCTVKGKSNYPCHIDHSITVDQAPCQFGKSCKDQEQCEYFIARSFAPKAFFLNTTYQFVLSLFDVNPIDEKTGKFSLAKDLYIFDECHNLPAIFTDYRTIRLGSADMDNYKAVIKICGDDNDLFEIKLVADKLYKMIGAIDYDLINEKNFEPVFADIFKTKKTFVDILGALLESKLKNGNSDDEYLCKHLARFHAFDSRSCCKYSNMIDFFGDILIKKDFVLEKSQPNADKWELAIIPLRVDSMFPEVADQLAPKRIFMSSTIFGADRLRKELGINKNYKFLGFESKFPVENRKVFSFPVATMNFSTVNNIGKMREVTDLIRDICLKHNKNNESGYIFTPSYSLAKIIFEDISEDLHRAGMKVIMNTSASNRDESIQKFRNEKDGRNKVLISPSFSEGVNFEGDISRFQIIPKVPFLSLGSRYISEKLKRDQTWYNICALTTIIQSAGRSIRSETDYATTYILDTNFQRLIQKYEEYIPGWFKDAIFLKK